MKKRMTWFCLAAGLLCGSGCSNNDFNLSLGAFSNNLSDVTLGLFSGILNARFGLNGQTSVQQEPGNDNFVHP